ncbi:hypothetical protein [Sphingomonas rubra]|uniref:Uncharacterized protein n=1 Tax=Sphingomonas rubra TaxID=634430 RepID=A0A1I5UVN0_9SPHN|nr:hypothetical protein [Sphingomonas rubra]SFP99303.1 hypothetical protein SAMN04488241_11713 [Sphingomonas rubra]
MTDSKYDGSAAAIVDALAIAEMEENSLTAALLQQTFDTRQQNKRRAKWHHLIFAV